MGCVCSLSLWMSTCISSVETSSETAGSNFAFSYVKSWAKDSSWPSSGAVRPLSWLVEAEDSAWDCVCS